jgi:branched-chain amino acid transport system permease protein
MVEIFGIPSQVLFSQLLLGVVNGSFYAMLSLGLAIIFGQLNIANFCHGAQYMMGAFAAWMLLQYLGLNYWFALIVAPVIVGFIAAIMERTMIARLYGTDPVYGILLTFGFALVIQGVLRNYFGSAGRPYAVPELLTGSWNLGFMSMPIYRVWVAAASVVMCVGTWLIICRTSLGAFLRASTENAELVEAFGVNVPRLKTLTYGGGVALAAIAGVFAAPIFSVSPLMGADLIIVVFAVVVIGGLGSIGGAIAAGFSLGIVEGLAKVLYPPVAGTVVFIVMVVVLLLRPERQVGR